MSYLINWTDTRGRARSTPVFIYGTQAEHVEEFRQGWHKNEIREITTIEPIGGKHVKRDSHHQGR